MSGIPNWARVGAKVVCVDDGRSAIIKPGPAVYVIESAGYFGCPNWHILVGGAIERADRFRPLITQQDDIETHFKALLDVPERASA